MPGAFDPCVPGSCRFAAELELSVLQVQLGQSCVLLPGQLLTAGHLREEVLLGGLLRHHLADQFLLGQADMIQPDSRAQATIQIMLMIQ